MSSEIMRKKNLFIIFVLIVIIVGAYGLFPISKIFCDEVRLVDMSIVIETKALSSIGVNTETDSLKFGKVSPLALVQRSLIVNDTRDAEVRVYLQGNLSKWTVVEPAEFTFKANEGRQVEFTVDVPESTLAGNYSGKALFCFKR